MRPYLINSTINVDYTKSCKNLAESLTRASQEKESKAHRGDEIESHKFISHILRDLIIRFNRKNE